MNEKKLYQETFSQVHTSVRFDKEAIRMKNRQHIRFRKTAVLAAVLIVALSCGATALAVRYFTLRDMVLPTDPFASSAGGFLSSPAAGEDVPPTELISLQGYADSPAFQAAAEWADFCAGYDPGGEILAEIGNGPTGLEERYGQYTVYTQEMADALDEIVGRYGLKLHTECRVLGIDEIRDEAGLFYNTFDTAGGQVYDFGGYIYEDGSLHFDGDAFLDGDEHVDLQFDLNRKDSFKEAYLNIGDADDYEQWEYENVCGTPVRLALSAHKGLVLADLEDSFVLINVLAGTDAENGGISRETLENLADCFDFTALK